MISLALDIGNSRIKSGLFEGLALKEVREWDLHQTKDFVAYTTNQEVEKIIFASVADHKAFFAQASLPDHIPVIELTTETHLPFTNIYQTPETLGKDRVAAVAGAWQLFPEQVVLIVDAGTCITFDLLTADRIYLGGNISPGLAMRYQAMHAFTANLPKVSVAFLPSWLGTSTEEALQNGGLYGMVGEIEYYRQEVERLYGNPVTVLTGGDAQVLAKKLKSQIFTRPHLVLTGLNQILRYNEERQE